MSSQKSPLENAFACRLAKLSDAQVIADFNIGLAKETEGLDLDPKTILRGVQRLLEKPQFGFYIVAERSGEVAGALMITYEWSDWRDGEIWWLQSVYVRQEFRRCGVFKQLMEDVRQRAKNNPDYRCFRLYVDNENGRAQKVYLDVGFHESNYKVFEAPQ
jgi:GNAT superfamily N-acetyltransferase